MRYALLVVLGYSRVLWCRFYRRQDMRTVFEGLEEAFRAFGGVPQELLFDQMKAVITRDLRLLVVDEIGYLPISRTGAMLFFQLMTRRYERASTVLTSNKGFEEWGEVFGDEVMAAALIDRLVHHCHLVTIRGNSYRMRQHTGLWQALHTTQEPEPTSRRRRGRQECGDGLRLVPSPNCQIFNRRKCQILVRR